MERMITWTESERPRWLVMLFLGCTGLYATRAAMPLCSVAVSKEMQWDKTQSGAALSGFFWGYAMTQCIGGYLSDRMGGEIVMAVAALLWGSVSLITPLLIRFFSNSSIALGVTVISRVVVGCCQGVHVPCLSSVLSQRVPEKDRAFSFASTATGCHFGSIISGSIGSLLLSYLGWPYPFFIFGSLSVLWAGYLYFVLVPKIKTVSEHKDDDYTLSEKVPFKLLFTSIPVWAIMLGNFCMNSAFFVLLSWMPTYFEESFPGRERWVYNVVPWLICLPVALIAGRITDSLITKGYSLEIVRKSAQTASYLGIACCLVLISMLGTYQGALVCLTLAMGFQSIHATGVLVNPQDIAPKYAGFVFGMMNTAGAIPGFVGVYIAGHILEATNSWAMVFNAAAGMCVLGWLIFTIFGTTKRIV